MAKKERHGTAAQQEHRLYTSPVERQQGKATEGAWFQPSAWPVESLKRRRLTLARRNWGIIEDLARPPSHRAGLVFGSG